MDKKYNHQEIESKWQKKWAEEKVYQAPDKAENKDNYYTLVEFPYPSGNLHIGHWYAFAVPDIFARMKRMQGYNVLFPIGFDAFGLPAENAAIKHGLDPKKWTYENIAHMEKQLQSMGNSFDWSRKVITSDPEYYKWTQWLFLKFYEKGLAYKKKASVNWCPKDQTVLANEQVVSGKCERCGTEVVQKDLDQWFFKITDYAERLLSGLDSLKWPEAIKEAQRNWIGRSEGAEISFKLISSSEHQVTSIKVFTTRADTLFGATYLVLAPEHEIISELKNQNAKQHLKIQNWEEIEKYVKSVRNKSDIERISDTREKSGVELIGVRAINPATGEEIPVWVADYVLASYGTGAVMAVPSHDERDFEFAKKFDLPIKQVIAPHIIDLDNPPKEGKRCAPRIVVQGIVRHWEKDEVIQIVWKKFPWKTFVIGGAEEGEDLVEAVKREVREETGYKNFKNVRPLSYEMRSEWYASHKDENRYAHMNMFEVILADGEKEEIDQEEKEKHEVAWVPFASIPKSYAHVGELKDIWEGLNIEDYPRCFQGDGILISSGEFSEMKSEVAREKIAEKFGKKAVKYKLRDWLLSRQRYWGCPIPIVYDPEDKPHAVPEDYLPWLLPQDVKDFAPKGESPIATSLEFKERTERIFGNGWKPEYDTMDTFVDSSWYFLRYCDPHNNKVPFDKLRAVNWMPVKRYSGGAEHTTMHLLYSRFFHKALFDIGLVSEPEPFAERMNRGLILGPDGHKMSKSKGNVIDPDEWVRKVGADTVRTYLAFIGPFNEVGQYPWDLGGIAGVRRFLEKIWRISLELEAKSLEEKTNGKNLQARSSELEALLHKTIKKVTEDIETFKFNTAISSMMIFVNELEKNIIPHEKSQGFPLAMEEMGMFLRILAPFAPHMTEEIWSKNFGYKISIHLEPWPEYNATKILDEKITIVVQVNGKVRASFKAEVGISEKEAREVALEMPEVSKWLIKAIKRVIFVKDKVINFIV
jgi:leucyl-tRNA synthetase